MAKPTEKPFWANNFETDVSTNAPNKEMPTPELQSSGLKRKEPFFRSHLNWMFDNIAKWIDYLDTVNSTISVDTTIYVATTGDDITGDGSILSPFATPQRALESLIGVPIATTALVTIFCAAGKYTFTEPVKLNHPYGERIHIIGDTLKGVAPSGAPVADWSSDKFNPIVPARGINEFYNSAGTAPVNTPLVDRQARILNDLNNNITLVESRYATIFEFIDTSGIVVDGNNSLGKIDKIAIKGDWNGAFVDPVDAKVGIDIGKSVDLLGYGTSTNVTGGTIFLGKDTVIIGFHGEGCRVRYSGSLTSEDGISIVNNYNNGARIEAVSSFSANISNIIGNGRHGVFTTGGSTSYLAGALSTGNINNGCQVTIGSSALIRDFITVGNGGNGLTVSVGSTVSFDNGNSKGNGATGITATIGATCDSDNIVISDNNSIGIVSSRNSTLNGVNIEVTSHSTNLFADDNSSILIASGTVEGGTSQDAYAVRNSYIKLATSAISSGAVILAQKRSYINTGNVSGVSYTPSYGTTGSDGSLIGD